MRQSLLFVLFFLFLTLISSYVFVKSVHAAAIAPNAETSQKRFNQVVGDDSKTNFQQMNIYTALFQVQSWNALVGGCPECQTNPTLADVGAIPGVGKMIAMTFRPPAHTQEYIADLLQDMKLAQPAYAQGLGFSALQPVLKLWKLFRDIAYVFFVFIFLIIGFAIMFRKSLGGQTAVTIQQALPRIVVALLAVSFSYAIAGLLVDMMWIVMYFLITMFVGTGLIQSNVTNGYNILNYNVFQVFGQIISRDFAGQAGVVVGQFVNEMIGNSSVISDKAGDFIGWISGGLAQLIILIAILFAMFKTFFSLIKVYLEIILSIIFAPVILMMGAINGNAFGNWLRGLSANLAVFPVLLVFILIAFMLIKIDDTVTTDPTSVSQRLSESGFVPPFLPGNGSAKTIGLIGGIAAIMLLPEVVGIVGKYKPSSIFDELAPKALTNVFTGNQLAAPLAFGSAAAGYGAVRGAYAAYKGPGATPRSILKGMYYGVQDGDKTYGGLKTFAAKGWGLGRKTASVIDRAKSNELIDPGILTRQADEFIKRQEQLIKRQGSAETDGGHSTSSKPSSYKSSG